MNEFYSESQMEIAQPLIEARKRFRTRMERRKDNELKMRWVLKHEMATLAERDAAAEWLLKNGWTRERIDAVKK